MSVQYKVKVNAIKFEKQFLHLSQLNTQPHWFNFSDSNQVLDNANIETMSQELGRRWKDVGRELKLTEGELQNLEHDYGQRYGQKEIIIQVGILCH